MKYIIFLCNIVYVNSIDRKSVCNAALEMSNYSQNLIVNNPVIKVHTSSRYNKRCINNTTKARIQGGVRI